MMHGWALFFSVFGVIFVAELPDKTALAALVLATRHRPYPVLVGTGVALSVQSVVAVAAGQVLSLLPQRPVHIAAGVLFLVSTVVMWMRKEGADADGVKDRAGSPAFWRTTWVSFVVVFVAEWGDLTQLATAALAARYRAPFVVFAGSAVALWTVASVAVFAGHHAGKMLKPEVTKRAAAVLFAAVGVALVAGLV